MTDGYFVDWLSVSQYHGADTPEFVGGLSFRYDETGEVQCETGMGRTVRGSFDTSLQIRSHGGWVSVSGNPGRFGRPDNLFGFSLDECMELVNDQLSRLGLPGFTRGERLELSDGDVREDLPCRWTGAAFSRIDVTRGFEAGSDFAARLTMRAYMRSSLARMSKAAWGGETVVWRTQRRVIKAYLKGAEMRAHGNAGEWADYATQRGIVRHEVEFKSKWLSETRLRYWGNVDMGKLIHLHMQETDFLLEPDTQADPVALESVPSRVRLTYAAWLKGQNVRELLPHNTFYRHRRCLLEAASVDIKEVRDVGHFVEPRIHTVTLVPAVAPAEYWRAAA